MSENNQMTETATTTTEGDTASTTVENTSTTGVPGSDQQSTDSLLAQGNQQDTDSQAEGEDTQTESQEDKTDGAPDEYEFQAAEGQEFDKEVIEHFSEVARELNLSQDAAQKVLDKMAPVLAQRQAEQINQVQQQWAKDAAVDKEFGGDKLNENLSTAKQAIETFATPELRELLNETGMGNHPEVIRVFYRVGKAISEDRLVSGSKNVNNSKDVRNMYGASNMNP